MRSYVADVDVIFQHQTERAICVRVDEDSKDDIWLPLSQVETAAHKGLVRGMLVTITAPQRLLEEKGLV